MPRVHASYDEDDEPQVTDSRQTSGERRRIGNTQITSSPRDPDRTMTSRNRGSYYPDLCSIEVEGNQVDSLASTMNRMDISPGRSISSPATTVTNVRAARPQPVHARTDGARVSAASISSSPTSTSSPSADKKQKLLQMIKDALVDDTSLSGHNDVDGDTEPELTSPSTLPSTRTSSVSSEWSNMSHLSGHSHSSYDFARPNESPPTISSPAEAKSNKFVPSSERRRSLSLGNGVELSASVGASEASRFGTECAPAPFQSPARSTESASTHAAPKQFHPVAKAATMNTVIDAKASGSLRPPQVQKAPPQAAPLSSIQRRSTEPSMDASIDPAVIVAHDAAVVRLFDTLLISHGVQMKIVAGIHNSLWTFKDVTEFKLQQLKGNNADAMWRVARVMKGVDTPAKPSIADQETIALAKEFDREQNALLENIGRGLGLQGDFEECPNWYGGRIQQRAVLAQDAKTKKWEIRLSGLEMRKSNRFARFLSSRRMIQVKIPTQLNYDWKRLSAFFSQRFIICGRVFRTFSTKEKSAYLMETDENYERKCLPSLGDHLRISLETFLSWHNPIGPNAKQPASKWSTRFQLGLSTSVPVLRLDPKNVFYIGDVYADFYVPGMKLEAHQIMTDGCGLINSAALRQLSIQLGIPQPIAIQARFCGAKGMWLRHPTDSSEKPRLWIRDSQVKIRFPDDHTHDQAHCILDMVAPDRSSTSHLTAQLVVNLHENGVSTELLEQLLTISMEEAVQKFNDWEGIGAMPRLWDTVNKTGRITYRRIQRVALGHSRALGVTGRFEDDEDGEPSTVLESGANTVSSPSDRRIHSFEPSSVHESALEMIQAGFLPQKSAFLADKLSRALSFTLDNYIKKYDIRIPESVEVFMVPDPLGTLEEGEVHYVSSQSSEVVLGPVLGTRNPIRLPSDVQKFRIVNHPDLLQYRDIAICSTKGQRSLASKMGGGDFDGDTLVMFWMPRLVEEFNSPPLSVPPADFERINFQSKTESIGDVEQQIRCVSPRAAKKQLQTLLLAGLRDTKVGLYSQMHDAAAYMHGLADERTTRLAFMFAACLDGAKTGLRVRDDVFRVDSAKFLIRRPDCFQPSGTEINRDMKAVRDNGFPEDFILQTLSDRAIRERAKHMRQFDLRKTTVDTSDDTDLSGPHHIYVQRAKVALTDGYRRPWTELDALEQHICTVHMRYEEEKTRQGKNKGDYGNWLSTLAQDFSTVPFDLTFMSDDDRHAVSAWHAYTLDKNFGFLMAFRTLCALKAKASSPFSFISREFSEYLALSSAVLRAFSRGEDSSFV